MFWAIVTFTVIWCVLAFCAGPLAATFITGLLAMGCAEDALDRYNA